MNAPAKAVAPDPVETFIRETFEENYQVLRLESSRALTPSVKESALHHVLLYWRKLRGVAEKITDTEVHLTLPNQTSPQQHRFSIHGVVDIIRDGDRTVMYDIKTHEAGEVREHTDRYTEQLNVYAHIWSKLRGQPLHETAIIATRFPRDVADALERNDAVALEHALADWDPLVDIPFDSEQVVATIAAFGDVVDAIENGAFDPPDLATLREIVFNNETFATRTCRNCDARFSCASYRRYTDFTYGRPPQRGRRVRDAAPDPLFDDFGPEADQNDWRTANTAATPGVQDLIADFT